MTSIVPSEDRIAALGEYLVALSKGAIIDQSTKEPTVRHLSAVAKIRLDILKIVGHVLNADRFHQGPKVAANAMNSSIGTLIELVAYHATRKGANIEKALRKIVNEWASRSFISAADYEVYRDLAQDAITVAKGATITRALPEWHGDINTKWNELPTTTMTAPMIENSGRAKTNQISRTRLNNKMPLGYVRELLDGFFHNNDLKYRPDSNNPTVATQGYELVLNPMGHIVKQMKDTSKPKLTTTAYGWSQNFSVDMLVRGIPKKIDKVKKHQQWLSINRPQDSGQARNTNRSGSEQTSSRPNSSGNTSSRPTRWDSGHLPRERNVSSDGNSERGMDASTHNSDGRSANQGFPMSSNAQGVSHPQFPSVVGPSSVYPPPPQSSYPASSGQGPSDMQFNNSGNNGSYGGSYHGGHNNPGGYGGGYHGGHGNPGGNGGGYQGAHNGGHNAGYNNGNNAGYNAGYNNSNNAGHNNGNNGGHRGGYHAGHGFQGGNGAGYHGGYNNNTGFNNSHGHGGPQSQGGYRGNYRGAHRGNPRGGYRGNNRGRGGQNSRGGRWN